MSSAQSPSRIKTSSPPRTATSGFRSDAKHADDTGQNTPGQHSTGGNTVASETDEQKLKQVEKLLKRAQRPQPSRPVQYSVQFEGWLKKKADRGFPGLKSWNTRYAVLYEDVDEIRYYTNMVRSNFGNLPMNERSAIPLHHIISVVPNEAQKWKGCRFDIHTTCDLSDYPRPRQEQTGGEKRTYSFLTPSATERDLWVQHLRSRVSENANQGN